MDSAQHFKELGGLFQYSIKVSQLDTTKNTGIYLTSDGVLSVDGYSLNRFLVIKADIIGQANVFQFGFDDRNTDGFMSNIYYRKFRGDVLSSWFKISATKVTG